MQRIMSIRTLLLTIFCSFFLAACGGTNEDTTVKNYLNAIASGNIDQAMTMIYFRPQDVKTASDKAAMEGKIKAMLLDMKEKQFDRQGGLKSIVIDKKEFSEDKKTVRVNYTMTLGNGTEKKGHMTLTLIDNVWKIEVR